MRHSLVLKVLSFLLVFIGGAILLPLPFSFYYNESPLGFLYSTGLCWILGFSGIILLPKVQKDIRSKEGFAIVGFGWLVFAFFGSLPYLFSGATTSMTDAFFETMSGITTTGATIFVDIEALPKGILMWRSLTQWFGGMGIIVLTVAILPFLGVGGLQLFKAEVPGPVVDKLSPRIAQTAKILWTVYVVFTALEIVLLMFGGMDLFDSMCHSFTTLATGGFSPKNKSVGFYSSAYIDYTITVFMIIAGTNFSLLYWLLKGQFKHLFNNGEFKFYVAIILGSSVVIGFILFSNNQYNLIESFRYSIFQVASLMTTTGFGTADYEEWSAASQLILLALMFIGGSSGSTGGGLKVVRLIIIIRYIYTELVRLMHPQAIVHVKLGGVTVEKKTLTNIGSFFMIYVLITASSTIVISLFGLDIVTSIGAVATTINNIGPGFGLVGPTENFAFLPDIVKWILSLLMMLGRLEIYTIVILLTPAFWKK